MHGDVILLTDLPEKGLRKDDIGTVVDQHNVEGLEPGYSVEFFDMVGNTVAVECLPQSSLRLPTEADRPAVRTDKLAACPRALTSAPDSP